MLTPEQYTAMKKTAKLNTNQWSLLVQSGGSSAQTTGEAQTGTVNGIVNAVVSGLNITGTTGRNKYFALDYYLDNLTIDTTLQQNGAMNATTLEFDVTEPNGITLLANLNRAARDAAQQPAGSVQNTQYVMVIRFYGYDAQGNLVRGGVNKPNATSDPNAFVEKLRNEVPHEFINCDDKKNIINPTIFQMELLGQLHQVQVLLR
jgi:hypothetical protein